MKLSSFRGIITGVLALGVLTACQPSVSEREQVLRGFVSSLVADSDDWKPYVPVEDRAAALRASPLITADLEIVEWDRTGVADICCNFRDGLYEYHVRFSNGAVATFNVYVVDGRVAQIEIENVQIGGR